jgi:hypothetical protein
MRAADIEVQGYLWAHGFMEKSANSIKCVCNDENSKNGIKVLDLT